MEPLVSVIIPVYNVFPYIREALDSVLHQTYQHLEIIIIDDGSDDGSGTICDEYRSDKRVVVIHQENRGLSGARNTGLDRMTGDYVAFLDPDDAYQPEMIRKMLDAVMETGAELGTCGFDILETDGRMSEARRKERILPEKEQILTPQEAFEALAETRLILSVWSKLYRAELWKETRFPKGCVYEDLAVLPYILEKCGRIAVIRQPLILYRQRKGSITRTNSVRNTQDYLAAYRAVGDYLERKVPPLPEGVPLIYQETMLRKLILWWAEIRRGKTDEDREASGLLEMEIQRNAERGIQNRRMKSKIVWGLYRHCPSLLLPARACFCVLKKGLREDRDIVA